MKKFILFIFMTFNACSQEKPAGKLVVFHAGSLSVPLKKILAEFSKNSPRVNVLCEAAGSVECARKISELKRPCDVLVSADYTVIDKMLMPDYTEWNIKFAANEMSIAYQKKSRRNAELSATNWYEVLLDPSVIYARSDPNTDPCGYRTVFMMQLSEKYYSKHGLVEAMLKKDVDFIRPKETDLLALLESGSVDYIFIYKSVAMQHGLKFLILPDEINLKNNAMAGYYQNAIISLKGQKPNETIIIRGQPIIYGITILKNASNYAAAVAFLEYVLSSEESLKILEETGHTILKPPVCESKDKLPDRIKKIVAER